jgi:DNA-binding SARP family transcriptional activator
MLRTAWRKCVATVPRAFRFRRRGVTLCPTSTRDTDLGETAGIPNTKPPLQLLVLGTVEFKGLDSATALLAQPKRLAVLVYLALARPSGFQRRDRLAGLFWPEHSDYHARSALRKTLHVIRQTIGDDVLLVRGDDEVAINRERLWCDGPAFNQALADEQFARALELFRGELLDGFFPDAPGFERWLETERNTYRESAGTAAWQLAERFEKGSDLTAATRWARKAAKLSGSDERRIRRVISLLDRAGDRAGAIHVYEDFARYVRKELDAEPSAETQALVKAVRAAQA